MYLGKQVAFWIAIIVTGVFYYWMSRQVSPLTGKEIVAFETALEAGTANAYLREWQAPDIRKEKLKTSIYLDFGFIFLYVVTIALGSRFIAALTGNGILQKAGAFFSWLIVAAGICDVVENSFMLQSLKTGATAASAAWAYYMAVTKFSIVLICLLFMVFCLVMYLLQLISRKQ